jgi:hypothetical protein
VMMDFNDHWALGDAIEIAPAGEPEGRKVWVPIETREEAREVAREMFSNLMGVERLVLLKEYPWLAVES